MVDELTIKQRKWLKAYITIGNATRAAIQVYDCKDEVSAASIGYENLRKLQIDELLEENGISDQALMQVLKEGLRAVKQISARIILRKNAVEFGTTGKLPGTDDFIEVEDMAVRHRYLETALKLKGKLMSKTDAKAEQLQEKVQYIVTYGEGYPEEKQNQVANMPENVAILKLTRTNETKDNDEPLKLISKPVTQ